MHWRKGGSSPYSKWSTCNQPWCHWTTWRGPHSKPWKPLGSYCLASSPPYKGRFKRLSQWQWSDWRKVHSFVFFHDGSEGPIFSGAVGFFFAIIHCSKVFTGGHFHRELSVCRDAPFHCHWEFGQTQSGIITPSIWNHAFDAHADFVTSCFVCISASAFWDSRHLYCFCILSKGAFVKDNFRFKVLIVCHGFCWWNGK